jgi:hypothetical protein
MALYLKPLMALYLKPLMALYLKPLMALYLSSAPARNRRLGRACETQQWWGEEWWFALAPPQLCPIFSGCNYVLCWVSQALPNLLFSTFHRYARKGRAEMTHEIRLNSYGLSTSQRG